MKYLVSTPAVLRFPDGTQAELTPGIHSFDDAVVEHWAFSAHAKPVDETELAKNQKSGDLKKQVKVLQTTIDELNAQLAPKDAELDELKAQLATSTQALADKDATIDELNAQLADLQAASDKSKSDKK